MAVLHTRFWAALLAMMYGVAGGCNVITVVVREKFEGSSQAKQA